MCLLLRENTPNYFTGHVCKQTISETKCLYTGLALCGLYIGWLYTGLALCQYTPFGYTQG